MKAITFQGVGALLGIEDLPDPEPEEGEVVIKVARCGVCGSDLHLTSGHGINLPLGSQFGHEFAGEVVAIGKGVERIRIGDHVAGMPIIGCGHCEYCATGVDILCRSYRNYGKGLAQYARLNERGVIELPRTVSLADGALVEPLAVGRRAVKMSGVDRDTPVLVMGPGPIGLAILFWLRRAGVRRIALTASSNRRREVAGELGADHFIVDHEGAEREILAALGGPPTIIFECVGTPGIIARAIDLVRPQGTIVSLGYCMVPDSFIPAAALKKEAIIRFSITYDRDDYRESADALDSDADRARAMVTDAVGLSAFPEAFEGFRQGKGSGGKLVVDPWEM